MSKFPSNLFRHAAIFAVVLLLAACQQSEPPSVERTESEPPAQTETERLMEFFEQAHQENVARSPMMQARLGIRDDYDRGFHDEVLADDGPVPLDLLEAKISDWKDLQRKGSET